MVGQVMLQVLEERGLPVSELIPVATAKSVGREIRFAGKAFTVVSMEDALRAKPDLALFSAGGGTSLEWAPRFVEAGATVIDNSSAWRMDPNVPLVVPEVNAHALHTADGTTHKLIANPNCSTIQLMVALHPLQKAFGLERVVVSTYQSVTGSGYRAADQLRAEQEGRSPEAKAYPHPIHNNVIPHCDVFEDSGYTREEMKIVRESRKILGLPELRITATAVRVPVTGGHSESVNVQLKHKTSVAEIQTLLANAPGIKLVDNPANNAYPMPKDAFGIDPVLVGRIRKDESADNAFHLWVVADNLRKGAATNAVDIAAHLPTLSRV